MSDPSSLRVADADREQVVEELREHAVAGRLTSEELEERIEQCLQRHARAPTSTRSEADLPVSSDAVKLALVKRKGQLRRRLAQEAGGGCRRLGAVASASGWPPAPIGGLLAGLGDWRQRCCRHARRLAAVRPGLRPRGRRSEAAGASRTASGARASTSLSGSAVASALASDRFVSALGERNRARPRGRARAPSREGARAGQAAGARARGAAARRGLLRRGGAAGQLG